MTFDVTKIAFSIPPGVVYSLANPVYLVGAEQARNNEKSEILFQVYEQPTQWISVNPHKRSSKTMEESYRGISI